MSNLVFPSLPGVSIEVAKTPVWKSTVHESVSGCQVSASAMTYPRWRYKLQFEFLRSGAQAELQRLVGFYNRHRGRAETWLYFDEEDGVATEQQFGIGDGVTTDFYLTRDFGGFIEPVTSIKQISTIKVGAATLNHLIDDVTGETLFIGDGMSLLVWDSDFSYAGNGRVSITPAPAAGKALIWSGEFYRRCRFKDDTLDFERFMFQLWKAKTVEFETHKGFDNAD